MPRFHTLDHLFELFSDDLAAVGSTIGIELNKKHFQLCARKNEGDVTVLVFQFAKQLKMKPMDIAALFIEKLTEYVAEHEESFISHATQARAYVNIHLKRSMVFKHFIGLVNDNSSEYGYIDTKKGQKVVIEHTSSNPNAPLHIGNLRNSLLGAHLAKLLEAIGYDVDEYFFVNDMGAQIGLTVFAYSKVFHLVKPTIKIDQWVGIIYAMSNTFVELQKDKVDLNALVDLNEGIINELVEASENKEHTAEYIDIWQDLLVRFPELGGVMLNELKDVGSIKLEGAQMNLKYEQNDPEIVPLYRQMVNYVLSAVQKTLDTYGIQHNAWHYESELLWDGSVSQVNDIVLDSPYFVPATLCNKEGVPEGGYIDLNKYIQDAGLKVGKGGYMKNYPRLYVFRPDGSTLYSFRDAVYSLKKIENSDLVLNIICSEQNLAQEKVSLALQMLTEEGNKLYHFSYDLVKLTTGKMSGRRGLYLLADKLYETLQDEVQQIIDSRNVSLSQEERTSIAHEVATATMKYSLLNQKPLSVINFDVAKASDPSSAGSGVSVLYNITRITSILRKLDDMINDGKVESPIDNIEDIDFTALDNDKEWQIFLKYVVGLSAIIQEAADVDIPKHPKLPNYGTHVVPGALASFAQDFSSYYKAVRILVQDGDHNVLSARIQLIRVFQQAMNNLLALIPIKPLEKM
ncbi:hypothetical protein PCE1_001833 [Barthelona sp. PCE]